MNNIHKRGFASMDKERLRKVTAKGGTMAHKLGRGHEWTSEEARAAVRIREKGRHTSRKKEE